MSKETPLARSIVERDEEPPTDIAGFDTSRPAVARVYDALLGGKDNFAADRELANHLLAITPGGAAVGRLNRAVLRRGVRFLVEQGIRQFIDIGSGLPTVQNTHEVAQAIAPDARVVYVDIDPIVLAYGRALLAENGSTRVIQADAREPEAILNHPQLLELIDFSQPVGLLLVAIIHHLNDDEDPYGLVARYREVLAPGSYVFVTHFVDGGEETKEIERVMLTSLGSGRFRTFEEIGRFFDGLELVEPGLVYSPLWRPDEPVSEPLEFAHRIVAAGIGHKP
ncbi:MAG: SAM-dependent methyltransferase [Frankia sp.]|nr:SAM-dependent methyltransferase [Frankia sp.]